jgi:hypothetical protein
MPLTLRIRRSRKPSPPGPKPCWGGQLPDDPLAKSACLWYANSSSASPIWPLRPARHLRHQDLCAAVRQRDPAASCAHEGTQARTRGQAVTGGALHGRDVTDDAFYEWRLSDYPDARAERDWRCTAHLSGRDQLGGSRPRVGRRNQRPARRAAHAAGPCIQSSAGRPDRGQRRSPLCRTRRGLLRPATPPSRDQRASLRPARLLDCRYPAHLTEPGSGAYPPPPEPGVPAPRGQVRMLNRRLDQLGLAGALDLAARFEELARTVRRPRRRITKRVGRAVLAGPGPRSIRSATRRAEAKGRHGATAQLRRIRAARRLANSQSRDLGTIHPGRRIAPDLQRQAPRPAPGAEILRAQASGHHAPRQRIHQGLHRAMQCIASPALRLGGTMTAVAHDHQGDKPGGAPHPRQLSPVPPPRDPADADRTRPTEPVPVRDAIAEYITKLIADAPLLPAEARSHLAALLTDTTDEA